MRIVKEKKMDIFIFLYKFNIIFFIRKKINFNLLLPKQ